MTTAIRQGQHSGATVQATISARQIPSIARIVAILGALLIDAIVILGFVWLSLGIGAEGQPGIGPDRPPPPMPAAPPAPSLPTPVAPPETPEPGSPPGPAWNVESDGAALLLARAAE